MNDRKTLVRVLESCRESRCLKEIQKCYALAFRAACDCSVIHAHDGSCDGTSCPERHAEIRAGQIVADAFTGGKEKKLVLNERTSETAAELIAAEILERLSIRSGCRQRFRAEVFEKSAMEIVGPGFGDDVDDTASATSEFGVGPARGDLEFLHGFQSDVNGRALAAHLFAKETVVVVPAVEADVVEDAALSVDIDFVAVRTLRNADAGSQSEQVFKLTAQNRSCGDRKLIESRGRLRLGDLDHRHVCDHDLLCYR
jgi:hypothetical protein